MVLIVSPLSRLHHLIAQRRPSHVITLLSPEEMIPTPPGFASERHLRLGVHDIASPQEGLTAPDASTVERILTFSLGWTAQAPMVIHCWAGISRSTAAAFVTVCALMPERDEHEIAWAIRRASPTATPNIRIVTFADALLDRRGRMVAAIESIGRGRLADEGIPFRLPLTA